MNIYLSCALIALLGLALSVMLVVRNLIGKAKQFDQKFQVNVYVKFDLMFQVAGTLIAVGIFLMLLGPAQKQYSLANNTLAVLAFFGTLGYLGSDVAVKFFGVVSNRINAEMNSKLNAANNAGEIASAVVKEDPAPENK